jgi:3'-5' exoribonuclease
MSDLPTLGDWLGDASLPWPAAATLRAGDMLVACYALAGMQLLRTRHEKPYLRLQLVDVHGPLEGRVWDDAQRYAEVLQPGSYVGVRGRIEIFNGERQLKVEAIAPVEVPPEYLELLLPRSRRDANEMDRELAGWIESVADDALRALLAALLGEGTDTGRDYRLAPAAKRNHHAYLGGLLEHTLSVTALCAFLAEHYADAGIDRDLLVTAALLHDIGKIRELGTHAGFPYTTEGRLLGHILIGLQLVRDAARATGGLDAQRLLLLEHLIASHQGRYEWQSPREPRILEGILLHYADDLDAKMNQIGSLLAVLPAGWSPYDRTFQREFLRHRYDAGATDESPPGGEAVETSLDAGEPAQPSPDDTLDLFEQKRPE